MKKLIYLVLFFANVAFSQVGINYEYMDKFFEIKGTVRLQKFDSNVIASRALLVNDKGDIGFIPQGKKPQVRGVYFKMMSKDTIRGFEYQKNSSEVKELALDLTIEINPYSETTIILDYNIPFTAINDLPDYCGIILYKNEGREPVLGSEGTRIEEGTSKYSLSTPPENPIEGKPLCFSTPVSGRAIDIIVNNTADKKTFTYSAKGLIEYKAGVYIARPGGISYFGYFDKNSLDYGTGIFIAQVYEKKL